MEIKGIDPRKGTNKLSKDYAARNGLFANGVGSHQADVNRLGL